MPLQFLDDADPVPASNIWLSLSLPMCLPYPPRSNEKYKQSARTSAGADKWLDVRVWDNTAECVEAVKGAGPELRPFHLAHLWCETRRMGVGRKDRRGKVLQLEGKAMQAVNTSSVVSRKGQDPHCHKGSHSGPPATWTRPSMRLGVASSPLSRPTTECSD
eukprot:308946-Pelagomonas_calceolata.AAC.3